MDTISPISRFLVVLAAFVIVVAGMKAAESLLVPFFLSLIIAIISTPPFTWMKSKGLPTWLALLAIVLVLVVVGVLVGAVVGSAINGFTKDLPEYQLKLSAVTSDIFDQLNAAGLAIDLQQLRDNFNPSKVLGMVGNTLASFGNIMTNFMLILLTVIFILAEQVSFSDKLRFNAKTNSSMAAIKKFTRSVNQYVAIKTFASFITGLAILIWLWVMGLDYFVLWGLLAFLLNFIPTIGSILAAVPAVLLAVVQLGFGDAALAALGFLITNFVVGNIIEPRIMGKGLDLSVLVVFLSLVFWGWILGPVGMLLSIPLTMTVKIALESFEETLWISAILGSGRSARNLREAADLLQAPEPKDD